jgi:hypothetical protein
MLYATSPCDAPCMRSADGGRAPRVDAAVTPYSRLCPRCDTAAPDDGNRHLAAGDAAAGPGLEAPSGLAVAGRNTGWSGASDSDWLPGRRHPALRIVGQEVSDVDLAGAVAIVAGARRHQVEAQEGQVGQVVLGESFSAQVGVPRRGPRNPPGAPRKRSTSGRIRPHPAGGSRRKSRTGRCRAPSIPRRRRRPGAGKCARARGSSWARGLRGDR